MRFSLLLVPLVFFPPPLWFLFLLFLLLPTPTSPHSISTLLFHLPPTSLPPTTFHLSNPPNSPLSSCPTPSLLSSHSYGPHLISSPSPRLPRFPLNYLFSSPSSLPGVVIPVTVPIQAPSEQRGQKRSQFIIQYLLATFPTVVNCSFLSCEILFRHCTLPQRSGRRTFLLWPSVRSSRQLSGSSKRAHCVVLNKWWEIGGLAWWMIIVNDPEHAGQDRVVAQMMSGLMSWKSFGTGPNVMNLLLFSIIALQVALQSYFSSLVSAMETLIPQLALLFVFVSWGAQWLVESNLWKYYSRYK